MGIVSFLIRVLTLRYKKVFKLSGFVRLILFIALTANFSFSQKITSLDSSYAKKATVYNCPNENYINSYPKMEVTQ